MAVRKLRSKMKPVIWIITIAMFLSMILVGVSSLKSSMSNDPIAFKVNKRKVTTLEVDRSIEGVSRTYSQYLGQGVDKDLVSTIGFQSVIEKKLSLDIAKKLKVKVPSSEVKAEYKKIEESIGNKEQFSRMLMAQGYNKTTLKEEIKNSLTIKKLMDRLNEDSTPTADEINKYFEENKYGSYYGKDLVEVKDKITKTLQEQNGSLEYVRLLEAEKKAMKLTDIDPKYNSYKEKVVLELDGFKITNYDMANRNLRSLFATKGNNDLAKTMAEKSVKNEIKIAKVAMEKGIALDNTLPVMNQLIDLRIKLDEKLRNDYKVDGKELKAYFEKNKLAYDTLPSVDAYIATYKVEASEADKAAAKVKAEEVLASVTPENFADVARAKSEGPSATNGGELGWFGKGQMVGPFESAAFGANAGTIVSEIVETQFGYHIIYVEDKKDDKVKASHILIKVSPSKKTKDAILVDATDAAKKVEAGDLNFTDLAKGPNVTEAKLFENISQGGYVPGLGYKTKLVSDLFAGDIDKVYAKDIDGTIYVYEKTKEVKYKKATLESVKEKVTYDFVNQKIQEELANIVK